MDVTSILLSAQSADHDTRTKAERYLKEAEEKNFGAYLITLADHLAGNEHDREARRLAGLIVKNAIYSRDFTVNQHLADRWVRTVDETAKNHVRTALLRALAAVQPEPRRAAAQVIAKIAAIDLSRPGAWDSLIPDLLNNASSSTEDHVIQAALEALGYTCEEVTFNPLMEQALSEQSNQILLTVTNRMSYAGSQNSTAESSASVRLAATLALNNTLEFARAQFEVPVDRTAIVEKICEAARSGDQRGRQAAFEGLVKIAEHYYDKLHEYIRDIYALTENAIVNDVEVVAMQAIEFWSTVAEEEVTIAFDTETARETGHRPDRENQNFIIKALPYLAVPIFDSLKKQEDDPLEDSSWNTATAAGACLELLAQAAPDTILELVKPFIETNIRDQANWRSREAAILAFGCILEGPPVENVKVLVKDAMGVLIDTLMLDANLAVKDTTAWTIARVVLVDRETTDAHLGALIDCLRSTLAGAENPELAAHICFAVHNIAERYADESEAETGSMTPYMERLTKDLLRAADRDDAADANLRISAYETINALFRNVPRDGVPLVHAALPHLIEKLQAILSSLSRLLSEEEIQDALEHQGLLCGALTTAIHRLTATQLAPHADRMMENYLQVFRVSGSAASLEDAFLAVGAVADAVGSDFNRYMNHFMPVLQQALSNLSHHQMVGVAVGVTGEVCRAVGKDLNQYADNIVFLLLEGLKSATLDRAIKPTILTCFGDVAMAIKGHFGKYIEQVMLCMRQAAESSVQLEISADDYDTLEWVHLVREAVVEAYTGIVTGLKDEGKQELLMPYLEWVLSFCEMLIQRPTPGMAPEVMHRPILALMGDLADAIPQFKQVARQKTWIQTLVDRAANSRIETTREMATWALNSIFEH